MVQLRDLLCGLLPALGLCLCLPISVLQGRPPETGPRNFLCLRLLALASQGTRALRLASNSLNPSSHSPDCES